MEKSLKVQSNFDFMSWKFLNMHDVPISNIDYPGTFQLVRFTFLLLKIVMKSPTLNCPTGLNLPKSQIMFHKRTSPQDLYYMTLPNIICTYYCLLSNLGNDDDARIGLRKLEPVCCKKQQKKFLTSYWFAEQGNSEGPE